MQLKKEKQASNSLVKHYEQYKEEFDEQQAERSRWEMVLSAAWLSFRNKWSPVTSKCVFPSSWLLRELSLGHKSPSPQ